jgi:stress response protein YsnF
MIVPILEEVLVVEKRLMLKEELHISRRRVEVHKPQHITLRSEEVIIERIPHEAHTSNSTTVSA